MDGKDESESLRTATPLKALSRLRTLLRHTRGLHISMCFFEAFQINLWFRQDQLALPCYHFLLCCNLRDAQNAARAYKNSVSKWP